MNHLTEETAVYRFRGCPENVRRRVSELCATQDTNLLLAQVAGEQTTQDQKQQQQLHIHAFVQPVKEVLVAPGGSGNHAPRSSGSHLLPAAAQLASVQRTINQLEYSFLPIVSFFDLRKRRSLRQILETAREMMTASLPIRCLEAVFIALLLTCGSKSLERIPVSLTSEAPVEPSANAAPAAAPEAKKTLNAEPTQPAPETSSTKSTISQQQQQQRVQQRESKNQNDGSNDDDDDDEKSLPDEEEFEEVNNAEDREQQKQQQEKVREQSIEKQPVTTATGAATQQQQQQVVQFKHIVLAIAHNSTPQLFGSLGLSRRSCLMDKPLHYTSLAALVDDFRRSYHFVGHSLALVRFGLPVPHDSMSRATPCWNFVELLLPHRGSSAFPECSVASSRAMARVLETYQLLHAEMGAEYVKFLEALPEERGSCLRATQVRVRNFMRLPADQRKVFAREPDAMAKAIVDSVASQLKRLGWMENTRCQGDTTCCERRAKENEYCSEQSSCEEKSQDDDAKDRVDQVDAKPEEEEDDEEATYFIASRVSATSAPTPQTGSNNQAGGEDDDDPQQQPQDSPIDGTDRELKFSSASSVLNDDQQQQQHSQQSQQSAKSGVSGFLADHLSVRENLFRIECLMRGCSPFKVAMGLHRTTPFPYRAVARQFAARSSLPAPSHNKAATQKTVASAAPVVVVSARTKRPSTIGDAEASAAASATPTDARDDGGEKAPIRDDTTPVNQTEVADGSGEVLQQQESVRQSASADYDDTTTGSESDFSADFDDEPIRQRLSADTRHLGSVAANVDDEQDEVMPLSQPESARTDL